MRPIIKIVLIVICALGAGWYVRAHRPPAGHVAAPETRVTVAPPMLPVAPPPKQ